MFHGACYGRCNNSRIIIEIKKETNWYEKIGMGGRRSETMWSIRHGIHTVVPLSSLETLGTVVPDTYNVNGVFTQNRLIKGGIKGTVVPEELSYWICEEGISSPQIQGKTIWTCSGTLSERVNLILLSLWHIKSNTYPYNLEDVENWRMKTLGWWYDIRSSSSGSSPGTSLLGSRVKCQDRCKGWL